MNKLFFRRGRVCAALYPVFFNPMRDSIRSVSIKVLEDKEVADKVSDLNDAFAEARTLITESHDNAGTIYFSDDIQDATEQTQVTLRIWEDLRNLMKQKEEFDALEHLEKEHLVKLKQLKLELHAARDLLDH